MTFKSDISEKWVLVIDDFEAMRSQLRMSLYSAGFTKLHVVSNIKHALERMANICYDVILCDYALGEGTDGQQFLEYLHTHDLITRNTIFVMITAEQTYKRVVAASEYTPDDYVLKPFTAAEFNIRLEKLLEKQEYFSAINQATDEKNWGRVITECDKLLSAKDKYFIDLCRIKCSALMQINRATDAANLYGEILALRPIGWAKLGLARALLQLDKKDEAKNLAQQIMEEMPQFMAAYDFLGKILADYGEKYAALEVLQKARVVSPGTMSRVREMSDLAVRAGKPEMAEEIMRQALQKHKYSPVLQANDYALLSKALINQDKSSEALTLVEDAKKSFKDNHSTIILYAMESLAHVTAGNTEKAATALAKAMSFGNQDKLPAHTAIALAEACFAADKEDDASKFLRHALQNSQDDAAIKSKIYDVLTCAGKDEGEATTMTDAIHLDAIRFKNAGAHNAGAGQSESEISMLCQATKRLQIDEDPYYVTLIAGMVDQQLIVASEDIYAANMSMLITKDTVICNGQWNNLLKHKLQKPLDQCLLINNCVTAVSLASDAIRLIEEDHRLKQLVSSLNDPAALFQQLACLPLSQPMAFNLTVAQNQQPDLYHHLLLVTLISQYIAISSSLPPKELTGMLYAALFHDVGELHVAPDVLNSKRQLSDIEWSQIYAHPICGYQIVHDMPGMDHAVSKAILQHQERLDGSGYPSGLRGAQIGIWARIISVADVCASILVRNGSNERLSSLMRLNNQKYDPKFISYLYRGFGHLTAGIDHAYRVALPQLVAVARLMEKWSKFSSTLSGENNNELPKDLEFLFERMLNLRSMLLQVGFDPDGLPQLVKLASEDPMVARELTEALCELNWQFKDLEREFTRRGEINNLATLNIYENHLLNDWIKELHANLAVW